MATNEKVIVSKYKLDNLANAINVKAQTSGAKNIDELVVEIENIETGITPTGTLDITENGEYDVTNYANVNVNVASSGGNTLKKLLDYTKSCGYMFNQNKNITDLTDYLSYEDTSNVTNMSYMFSGCSNLTTIPQLDTSNVTIMSYMFSGCSNLTTIPQLDTSNVTIMSSMFSGCSALTTIPLDVSKIRYADHMFKGCSSLTTIQLDISKCTETMNMFEGCKSLTTVQIDNSKSDDRVSMPNMFKDCRSLTTVQIDTNKCWNTAGMFYNCIALLTVQLDMRTITSTSSMFNNCKALTNLTLLNIETSLQVGSDSSWGHLLTLESLIGLCQQCVNVKSSRTLTVGSVNLEKLANVYVKLTGEVEADSTLPKLPMVQCESTDEGAMLITDYMNEKGWTLA